MDARMKKEIIFERKKKKRQQQHITKLSSKKWKKATFKWSFFNVEDFFPIYFLVEKKQEVQKESKIEPKTKTFYETVVLLKLEILFFI